MSSGGTAVMDVEPATASKGSGSKAGPSSKGCKGKPRFEVKKYGAVALWAWGT